MRGALLALGLALVSISACDAVTSDSGLDAQLRIEGAQFFRGPMPDDGGGPRVQAVNLTTSMIRAGAREKAVTGALAPEATAAAIALGGDQGYWVVPAGVPDVTTPDFPGFKALLSFSATLAPGAHDLQVRAVDTNGRFGAADVHPLTAANDRAPAGRLVVSLAWDTESDLDLYVVDANGVEISKRNINSYEPPPPGQAPDPTAYQSGALLDFDSNAACVIDGRRAENVVWKMSPPAGHYVVRVDTPSLCLAVSAHWTVEALLSGASLGRASGQSFETDTRYAHDRGAGVVAMEFDVP